MDNKIVSSKLTITIFLAIVLFIGTIIAVSSQSLFLSEAHTQPYYDGEIYDGYSYEPSQYQSYEPDYKPKYSSYGKDNSYNTKDNDILKKIKCNNNNININGENTGDIILGTDGQGVVTEEGYRSAGSFGSVNDKGYNQKGFDCITNNNDNKDSIIQGGTGQSGQGAQGERGLTGATGLTGMTGPPGEDGMDGAQGPRGFNGTDGVNGTQGPPGITFINNTNTYVRTEISTAPATFVTTAEAYCDIGDFLIHGGFTGSNLFSNAVTIVNDEALGVNGESGWKVILNSPNSFQNFIVKIGCFDNPPLRP